MDNIVPMAAAGLNNIVVARILAEVRERKMKTVTILDLGSGEGYNAARLAEGLETQKVDFRITCIDITDARFKLKHRENITMELRDLNADFALGHFDFVVGTEILEHVENPYHFLRMCLRNLSPEGVCYLTTPNPEHIFSLIKQFLLGRPMWFSVDEPSGHIMPIHNFMVEEALRRIEKETGTAWHLSRTFNRNCFPLRIKDGHLRLSTVPGNNRVFGEINIYRISR